MSSLAQLRTEHAELIETVRQLEALIAGDEAPQMLALFEVRRSFRDR